MVYCYSLGGGVVKEIVDYGRFEITLEECLAKKGVSKNILADKANLQRTQLNNYCKNNIKRPDFDVLARISNGEWRETKWLTLK